jgi:aryl-alcohol dehydrogenase-like predicted oxidoreductase
MTGSEPGGPRLLWSGGPTGLPLGVGAWAWGDRRYWGYGRDYTSIDVAAAYAASREAGLTLFDTAETYGRGTSERLLGGLMADDADRGSVAVATKFAALPWRVGRRGPLMSALEGSLERLDLAKVALYQIHWPLPLGTRGWLLDLAAAYDQGLIGAVGVSNYPTALLRRAHRVLADQGVPLATNQVEYSLLTRRPERSGLVEACRQLDVTIIAYSPLAQGLLTGKYAVGKPPPGVRGLRWRRQLRSLEPLIRLLTEIGSDHDGRTPAQVALNWLIRQGTVPIPGAKTAEQARHNAGGVGWSLTDDEVAEIDRVGG